MNPNHNEVYHVHKSIPMSITVKDIHISAVGMCVSWLAARDLSRHLESRGCGREEGMSRVTGWLGG